MNVLLLLLLPLVMPFGVGWWVYADAKTQGLRWPVLWGSTVGLGFEIGFFLADLAYSVFISELILTGRIGNFEDYIITWTVTINTISAFLTGTAGLFTYLALRNRVHIPEDRLAI